MDKFYIRDGCLIGYCDDLEDVIIPEGVNSISDDVFYDKIATRTVTLPASFERIDGWVFSECGINRIIINEHNPHMKMIDNCVYSKDGSVLLLYPPFLTQKSFEIPHLVKKIGDGAFYGSRLERIVCNCGLVQIGEESFMASKQLKEIVFSDTVMEIGREAFAGCDKLKSITLPTHVKLYL